MLHGRPAESTAKPQARRQPDRARSRRRRNTGPAAAPWRRPRVRSRAGEHLRDPVRRAGRRRRPAIRRAGDVAHHVVQEGVGRDLDLDAIAVAARRRQPITRRTGVGDWHSAARNAEKSCSPDQRTAPPRACASASSGRRIQQTRRRSSAGRTRRFEDAVAGSVRESALKRAWKSSGTCAGPEHAQVAAARRRCRRAPRPARAALPSVSKCATCIERVHAGVGAAGRSQLDRVVRDLRQRALRVHPARCGACDCNCQPA